MIWCHPRRPEPRHARRWRQHAEPQTSSLTERPRIKYWIEELALVEAAALRIEAQEEVAEHRFDDARARSEAGGETGRALTTREFASWMTARHDTDAAWGRWSEVMNAKPTF